MYRIVGESETWRSVCVHVLEDVEVENGWDERCTSGGWMEKVWESWFGVLDPSGLDRVGVWPESSCWCLVRKWERKEASACLWGRSGASAPFSSLLMSSAECWMWFHFTCSEWVWIDSPLHHHRQHRRHRLPSWHFSFHAHYSTTVREEWQKKSWA